ncbi:MAG: NifU family protein [Deltaproteobacteria bacterium]|nr:NifU family protein [Deltaproteobacteria bacterium]
MAEELIKIMAEPQADPNRCRFTLDKNIIDEGSFFFNNAEEARGSALPEALFAVGGIGSVLAGGSLIQVVKSTVDDWRAMAPKIGAAIRAALNSGKPLVSEEAKKRIPDENEIRTKVNALLEKEINPAVASHGGVIELLDVKKNDIFIKMGGGCQGCAMSTATLKQGVEQSLRKEIPYLGAIYDTTDHAAGTNPYYSAS